VRSTYPHRPEPSSIRSIVWNGGCITARAGGLEFLDHPSPNGEALVFRTQPRAPKLATFRANPHVQSQSTSTSGSIRSTMFAVSRQIEMLDDISPEFAVAAERYLGPEQAGPGEPLRGQPVYATRPRARPGRGPMARCVGTSGRSIALFRRRGSEGKAMSAPATRARATGDAL
jgi:hypothetical protein